MVRKNPKKSEVKLNNGQIDEINHLIEKRKLENSILQKIIKNIEINTMSNDNKKGKKKK